MVHSVADTSLLRACWVLYPYGRTPNRRPRSRDHENWWYLIYPLSQGIGMDLQSKESGFHHPGNVSHWNLASCFFILIKFEVFRNMPLTKMYRKVEVGKERNRWGNYEIIWFSRAVQLHWGHGSRKAMEREFIGGLPIKPKKEIGTPSITIMLKKVISKISWQRKCKAAFSNLLGILYYFKTSLQIPISLLN